MWTVVLLLLEVTLTCASTHSLTYFFTAVSGDIDFPEFTIVGLVNEEQFMYFDSNTKKVVPKTEWMKQKEGAEYWDTQTRLAAGTHHAFRNNIQVAKDRFNHSTGVHTFQLIYGCEWDNQTGATNGFRQEGYDGEDFMSLDLKEMRWISPVQQGFSTQNKWNNNRAYLEVSPQVSLLQKSPSSPVVCHATGFYPSGVTITWTRNGQEHRTDVDLGEHLPNEDGTFQRTSTRVKPSERFCQRKRLEQTGDVSDHSVPVGIIVFAVVLLIVIGVTGYIVYLKKRGEDGQL